MIKLFEKRIQQETEDCLDKMGLTNRPANMIIETTTANPNPIDIWHLAYEQERKRINNLAGLTIRPEAIDKARVDLKHIH